MSLTLVCLSTDLAQISLMSERTGLWAQIHSQVHDSTWDRVCLAEPSSNTAPGCLGDKRRLLVLLQRSLQVNACPLLASLGERTHLSSCP